MSTPSIPARCIDRPQVGGLVVPAVTVVAAGRPRFGSVHNNKAMECITQHRCQICGQPLGFRRCVVIVTAVQLADCYSPEAPLHPECAHYSVQACPMLAGTMPEIKASDRHIGVACDVAGCDCGGWVNTFPDRPGGRRDAPKVWFMVWLADYAIAINDKREVHGLSWQGQTPLRVREVPRAEAGDADER